MRIGLIDIDRFSRLWGPQNKAVKFPNLALLKLSAFYKSKKHSVELYSPGDSFDLVFASKIFTYTEELELPENTIRGGFGFGIPDVLPSSIEHTCPDYDLLDLNYSLGFLTRGCPKKCPHCFVPSREGSLRDHAELDEFVRHDRAVFLDNNILASDHGLRQIEEIVRRGLRVDFNQGLDSDYIDETTARLLSRVKWSTPLRLACDSMKQVRSVEKAVRLLRWFNVTPSRFFCYMLVTEDVDEAIERARILKGLYLDIFAQPFRDEKGSPPDQRQKDFARWINHKPIFKSVLFEDYEKEKIEKRLKW
jgi:hypothetical protein